jgi:hypothetical protein
VNYTVSTLTDLIALDWDHTTYPWVVSMNKNMNSGNLEINTTVRANESSASRDFVANISFTLNGKPYSRDITVTQGTDQWLNKVWYGYSDHTPTSFNDKGTSTETTAVAGRSYTVDTLANAGDVMAKCHYLILPKDSPFTVDTVNIKDGNGFSVEVEIDNIFGDSNKEYTMWYRQSPRGVIYDKDIFPLIRV